MAIAATGSEDEHKEMKEGKGDKDDDSSSSSNKNKYREDELEVADVLLQLRSSISITNNNQFEYKWKLKLKLKLKWGAKKPRSALLNPPINNNNNNNYCKHIVKQPQQAPSPTTPLSFSPTTQTPYKFTAPLHLRKKELKEAVEQKLQTQHQLKQSILKVKEYLNTIMAENSALKAHKRLLVNGEKEDRKKMKLAPMTKQGSSGLQVVQQPPFDHHHIQDVNHHQLKQHPPLIHPRHHYHHGAAVAVWMNDPLYAPTPLHLHYPQQQQQQQQQQQPLIHHQAYPMLQYNHHHHRSQQQQQQQQKQHVVHIDLNVLPSAEDEHIIKRVEAQEARKNRMRVNKDKKTRVP